MGNIHNIPHGIENKDTSRHNRYLQFPAQQKHLNMSDKWWMLDADAVAKDKSLNEPLLNKKDDLEAQMGDLDDDDDDDDSSLDGSDDEGEGNNENGAGSTAEPEKQTLGARFWYVVTASLGTVGANGFLGYLFLTSAAALASPIVLLPLAAGMFASMTSVFAIIREKKIAGITCKLVFED